MSFWPNLPSRACKESRATDNKKGGDRNGGEGGPRKPRAELIQTMDAVFGEGISSEGIRRKKWGGGGDGNSGGGSGRYDHTHVDFR